MSPIWHDTWGIIDDDGSATSLNEGGGGTVESNR